MAIDSEGTRAKKVDGPTTTYYIRGADGSVLAEYDGTSTLTTKYVYAGTKRLALVGSTIQYYLTDHLGDTRALLKSDGTIPTTYGREATDGEEDSVRMGPAGSPGGGDRL